MSQQQTSLNVALPVGSTHSQSTSSSSSATTIHDIVPKFSTPPPSSNSAGAPDSFQSAEQEFSNTFDIILGTSLVASFSLYRVFNFIFRAVTFQVVLEPTEATDK